MSVSGNLPSKPPEGTKQEPVTSLQTPHISAHELYGNGIINKIPPPSASSSVATLAASMPPPAAAAAAATALIKRKSEAPIDDPVARQKEMAALQEARQRELAASQEVKRRFAQQHYVDKSRAIQPDYQTPFSSQQDILNRLLAYHVLYQPPETPKAAEDWKAEYAKKALDISTRLNKMKDAYERHVVRPPYGPREEGILLNKLQYFDDKIELDHLKAKLGILPKPAPAATPPRSTPAPTLPASSTQLVRTGTPMVGTPQYRAGTGIAPTTPSQPRPAPSAAATATTPSAKAMAPPPVPPVKKPQPYVPPQSASTPTAPTPQPVPPPSKPTPLTHPILASPPTPAQAQANALATLASVSAISLPALPIPQNTNAVAKLPLPLNPTAVPVTTALPMKPAATTATQPGTHTNTTAPTHTTS